MPSQQTLFSLPPKPVVAVLPSEQAARDLLTALWPRVAATVSEGVAAWRSRNKVAALSLVEAGFTVAEVLDAHEALSARWGAPVRMLGRVAEDLMPGGVVPERIPDYLELVRAGKITDPRFSARRA